MQKLLAIFLLGLCIKSVFLLMTEPGGRDSWELGKIAAYIADGKGYISPFGQQRPDDPCIHFAPGVPAYLAALQLATGSRSGSQAAAAWINVVLSAMTGVLLVILGKRLFDEDTGLWAGVLYGVCPASCHFVASSWSATILALLGTAWVLLAARLRERPTWPGIAGFGAATAVLALIDTPFLLVAPVAVLAAMIPTRKIGWIVGGSALSATVFLIVVSPWLLRCWLVTDGHLIPLRGNFGMELWVGNHPGADSIFFKKEKTFHPYSDPQETVLIEEMGELQYNRHCLERASAWISQNPSKFRSLIGQRFAMYWLGSSIIPSEAPSGLLEVGLHAVKVALQGVPLLFAIIGIGLALYRRHAIAVLLGCLILTPLPHYFTHSGWTRYRLPLDPIIYLFAACALVTLWSWRKENRNHGNSP